LAAAAAAGSAATAPIETATGARIVARLLRSIVTPNLRSVPPIVTAARLRTVAGMADDDLAEALELRDELLLACRELLLGVGTREAAALVAHIDALLDLDDEASSSSLR
jgi:hypothetical protein